MDLGLPNPIANGKNKVGLEDVGKMMPIDQLQPSEERRLTKFGPLAYTKGKRDAKVMTKEAEVKRRLWRCLYSIFPFST